MIIAPENSYQEHCGYDRDADDERRGRGHYLLLEGNVVGCLYDGMMRGVNLKSLFGDGRIIKTRSAITRPVETNEHTNDSKGAQ
ncbi:MAG TPA: hypothetical protein VMU77_01680 [Acidimicrobiales bacterium]|nr:hypothetical protein [Acidimicrobiales bacterium]